MHRLCRCIKLSATFHLINQFYTSRISVRFVKAGSESQWSTTPLAWSQLCTDVGIAWTGPTAGSGTLALAWQTISWSSSILCVNTLIRVTGVCSSRVTENRVIPVYCSIFELLLCTKTINLFHLDFFSMYLRQRHPFPVFSVMKKISNFLFTRTKLLKCGCWITLRYTSLQKAFCSILWSTL